MKTEQDYAIGEGAAALLYYTDEGPYAAYAVDFFVAWDAETLEPEQYVLFFRERNDTGDIEDTPEAIEGAPWVFV